MTSNETSPLAAERVHPERAIWPRAIMATLLAMIASLTIHLVEITWFDGPDSSAAIAAEVSDAAAPYRVAAQR
ncbi:MAG: hypothetical protein H0U85_00085 [Gemmatimonadales bacterium]|nr:hypothetical protein [Gemmatimonadales bacterium]